LLLFEQSFVLCVLLLFEESFVLLHQSSKSSFVRRGVLQPKVGGMGVASAACCASRARAFSYFRTHSVTFASIRNFQDAKTGCASSWAPLGRAAAEGIQHRRCQSFEFQSEQFRTVRGFWSSKGCFYRRSLVVALRLN
jgi:hypothetical protein